MIAGADPDATVHGRGSGESEENLQYFSVIGLPSGLRKAGTNETALWLEARVLLHFNVTRTPAEERDLPQSTLDLIARAKCFDMSSIMPAKFLRRRLTKTPRKSVGSSGAGSGRESKDHWHAAPFRWVQLP